MNQLSRNEKAAVFEVFQGLGVAFLQEFAMVERCGIGIEAHELPEGMHAELVNRGVLKTLEDGEHYGLEGELLRSLILEYAEGGGL